MGQVSFFRCGLSASQLGVGFMNWISTVLIQPRLLPRLDYSSGIPPASRTMVVVPTMLTSLAGVDKLLETLEIHHLSTRDSHLHFSLLTDYPDSDGESAPDDIALLHRARDGVHNLNTKYGLTGRGLFFLFHRPRRWNPTEGLWMGYERKRGKLTELNGLLRGGSQGCFSETVGDLGILPTVKYVITLDTDTQLPRDAARQLAGTMAHPLNHPRFDSTRRVVTEGYSILQPRIGVSLPSARRSWFVRLLAGDVGIDPYTREVSDVYQDLFREGSFVGKGIYDVDAFEKAMNGRFPENTVLSHDLLEACHARSGLVSDVEFYEEHPSRYSVDMDRRHRWIRGDWQIAQWLFPRVPGTGSCQVSNPLSALSQWKILDNLRRSLVPVAMMVLILGAWFLAPRVGDFVPFFILATFALPTALSIARNCIRKPEDLPWMMHLRDIVETCGRQGGQILLTLTFLPYDAFISIDAVSRTSVRILVTHRRLLEWRTSSDSETREIGGRSAHYATMWITPAVAVVTGLLLIAQGGAQLVVVLPILALWIVAPWIAWWVSQPTEPLPPDLNRSQLLFLRQSARAAWHYFETFVVDGDNWLPPDNVQDTPEIKVAHRTSPTNLGLTLLANLAARDLGYSSLGHLILRTTNTLNTMARMERYRGHFYNWYETRTLTPLHPLYVSSVDSGNLAGHLLTLAAGLREQARQLLDPAQSLAALRDTVRAAQALSPGNGSLAEIEAILKPEIHGSRDAFYVIRKLTPMATLWAIAAGSNRDSPGNLKAWSETLRRQCEDCLQEALYLTPWLVLTAPQGPDIKAVEANATPADSKLAGILARLDAPLTLNELAELDLSLCPWLDTTVGENPETSDEPRDALRMHLLELSRCLKLSAERARGSLLDLENLARRSDEMAVMDFTFLFDKTRDLFSIGFNVADCRRDLSFYDLLASEARLCSYVAIALGQVSQDHWFSMGRPLVASRGGPVLVSWSGSMFEYLMPLLVMPNYENTLLDQTCQAAVLLQMDYGNLRGVPWGISESGYNRTDTQLNYQYRAFGVPGMGLKRGLADDLVIAPYASALALMVKPEAACRNLERLAADGRTGPYGFYEAIDFTRSRLPPAETSATIHSYMVHHQAMTLLALVNVLTDSPMQRRFLACPLLKAACLLLQERVHKTAASTLGDELGLDASRALSGDGNNGMRISADPSAPTPEVHLLSNGNYHVVITSAGGGYSRWRDLAVTRWREDSTRDCWGTFLYLRNLETGVLWSATHQPTLRAVDDFESVFTQSRAEFRHSLDGFEIHAEISVSPEDDVELRRIRITNHSSATRTIELTSYTEVVLAAQAEEAAHPAFANLFVQTELAESSSAVLCTRRARSLQESPPWLFHLMLPRGGSFAPVSCETDRSKFIGRGGNLTHPAALQGRSPLSNTVGSVLDPILSLRRAVTLGPHESVIIDFVLGVAESRVGAEGLIAKYQSERMADRAFDLAWTHSQVTLQHLNSTEAEAQLYGRLAGALIYGDPARRASPSVLLGNRRGQNGLWSYGISGDAPIVLIRISDVDKIDLVRQLIQAHSYWRMKGLTVDLVILNEDLSGYRQTLQEAITNLISSGIEAQMLDKPGGIFVRRLEQLPNDDLVLLQAAARIVLDDEKGTLAEQLEHRNILEPVVPALAVSSSIKPASPRPTDRAELKFANGFGGFTPDGNEYRVTVEHGRMPPAPWVNVIANPYFGTVISESGAAYTWFENSHEFRLTPWSNDPVQDTTGEALYIRDEDTGEFWSPTPLPVQGATPYLIRHGFGYTIFEHTESGITTEVSIYVATDAPVKFTQIKLKNISGRPRRLSVTGYWEWVLGDLRAKNLLHVQTELDLRTGALMARNFYNTEFPDRVVFLDLTEEARTFTGDRKEFIGRNGTLARPAALKHARLSGRVGAGLDPCGALQVAFNLLPGQERDITFRLGVGRNLGDAQNLIRRFRRSDSNALALEGARHYWRQTLGAVTVETPDSAVNFMANGWLLYQTLSCRLWGRTGFYQSGGAFGFRDQLQDAMALVHAEPGLTREHLLRAAARQFQEGDVQHWWHPPSGRGVRTHFSDDYLWLPYATCHYVSSIADTGVLDEQIPFLDCRPLKPDEEAYYELPRRAENSASLYQHCVRAIENGLRFGQHGLPLMGGGDWNDGMNRVGIDGRGESVWLAFFLYDVLTKFSPLARSRRDIAFADRCLAQARELQTNIEKHAWDGDWYRRAFFDNGEPLGSKSNPECQIDSIPQSWSILSGAGDSKRATEAMEAVDKHLIHRDSKLIQLFSPPFDHSAMNPGYIRGYMPGVRENGGQYTHAAVWTVMAFALNGDTERAWELFNLINPISHGNTPETIAVYKVEP